MSAPQVILLTAAAVPTVNTTQPFVTLNTVSAQSPGAAVIYGVNKQSENSANYARFVGDASQVVFNESDDADLANAHTEASITAANYLNTVVLANGVALTRVASAATPSAGEFKISTSGQQILTLGTTYGVGTKIEVYMSVLAASPVVVTAAAATVAGQTETVVCYDFMRATTANATLEGQGH